MPAGRCNHGSYKIITVLKVLPGNGKSFFYMHSHELLDRCKQNDRSAQRALYDHYKSRLLGLCRRYARNREDAQDMLQEAFIKIFTRIAQVESQQKFEGWMKTIAVRTAIDHYHRMKKHDQPVYTSGDYEIP